MVLAIVLTMAGCASSPKNPIVINEKYKSLIQVENIEAKGDKITVNAKDTPRLLLLVPDDKGNVFENLYPKFKEKLISKGFVVVNKPEDADVALVFGMIADYMKAANDSSVSSGIGGEKIAGKVGAAVMTGGISLIGDMFNNEERAVMTVQLLKSPMLTGEASKWMDKQYKSKTGSDWLLSTEIMDLKRNEKTPAVSYAIVDTISDAWLKDHVVDNATAITPISAVAK